MTVEPSSIEFEDVELVRAAPDRALLRVTARAPTAAPREPTLLVRYDGHVHRVKPLPSPPHPDGWLRAAYSLRAGVLKRQPEFALELSAGVFLDLPDPTSRGEPVSRDHDGSTTEWEQDTSQWDGQQGHGGFEEEEEEVYEEELERTTSEEPQERTGSDEPDWATVIELEAAVVEANRSVTELQAEATELASRAREAELALERAEREVSQLTVERDELIEEAGRLREALSAALIRAQDAEGRAATAIEAPAREPAPQLDRAAALEDAENARQAVEASIADLREQVELHLGRLEFELRAARTEADAARQAERVAREQAERLHAEATKEDPETVLELIQAAAEDRVRSEVEAEIRAALRAQARTR